MMSIPSFYGKHPIGALRFWQRDLVEKEALANRNKVKPSSDDVNKIGVFIVDAQFTFCSKQANQLYVPGSEEDLSRVLPWMLKNVDKITKVWATLDTHVLHQIFHRWAWVDSNGVNPPASTPPFASVFPGSGLQPTINPLLQNEYVAELLRLNQPPLTIWPTHSLLGEAGHALVTDLFEVLAYRDIAKKDQTVLRQKGTKTFTEAYGAGKDNVMHVKVGKDTYQIGEEYTDLLDALDDVDQLVIWGEALDFCVRDTIMQIFDKTSKKDPRMIKKIFILSDAMSSIFPNGADLPNSLYGQPGQPKTIHLPSKNEIFDSYRKLGMNVVTTNDNFLL